MQFDGLKDKVAFITGASSGIGQHIVKLLSANGATVGIHYAKNKDAASALKADISSTVHTELFQADLADIVAAEQLLDRVIERFGRIDIMVNNAGGVHVHRRFTEIAPKDLEQAFALNFHAPFMLARKAFECMQAQGGGRIINISSIGVKFGGSANSLHYACAKSAMETMTVGLARLGAPHNILVNAIRPGIIDTPFHQDTPEKNFTERVSLIPLKRMGTTGDIAQMAAYLASDAGSFITGQIFAVSGGE